MVVAYGKILPKRILDLPKTYCINIHASLLPKYRGAGPIQWCILKGESETGVTSMIMGEGLDTGDMLIKAATEIGVNETADELHDRLAVIGADVLLETVKAVKTGDIHPQPQDDEMSCYAPMLTKELCPIDFSKTAKEIHDQIRGLSSWPCAVAQIAGRRLKVYHSELDGKRHEGYAAGDICDKDKFTVVCGDGFGITFTARDVRLVEGGVTGAVGTSRIVLGTEVQADGGKRMKTADYLRGNKL